MGIGNASPVLQKLARLAVPGTFGTNFYVKIGFGLALDDSKTTFLHPAGMDMNNLTVPQFDTVTNLTPRAKRDDLKQKRVGGQIVLVSFCPKISKVSRK